MIFTPLFAEVSDKEPGLFLVWGIGIAIFAACFLLCHWRLWASSIAVSLAAFWLYATASWLRDPYEGPAIVRELGRDYVAQAWFAGIFPLFFTVGSCLRRRVRRDICARP